MSSPSPTARAAPRRIRGRPPATLRVLALSFTPLLAAGCGGVARFYDGPPRPREQVAVVQPSTRILFVWQVDLVEVGAIDGKPLGLRNTSVEVLPGTHLVSARRGFGNGPKVEENLLLDAKAGHVYEVHKMDVDVSERIVAFWIVDTADGSVVAGERPPDATGE